MLVSARIEEKAKYETYFLTRCDTWSLLSLQFWNHQIWGWYELVDLTSSYGLAKGDYILNAEMKGCPQVLHVENHHQSLWTGSTHERATH